MRQVLVAYGGWKIFRSLPLVLIALLWDALSEIGTSTTFFHQWGGLYLTRSSCLEAASIYKQTQGVLGVHKRTIIQVLPGNAYILYWNCKWKIQHSMAATDSKIRWWYADSYLKPIEKQPCQFISCWSLQRQQEVLVATCLASKRGWWERTSLLSFSPWDYKKIPMLLAFLDSRIIFFT